MLLGCGCGGQGFCSCEGGCCFPFWGLGVLRPGLNLEGPEEWGELWCALTLLLWVYGVPDSGYPSLQQR